MNVREWMSTPAQTVKPLDTVAHARELLERHRINQLPVVVRGKLAGIVTDRDLRDAFPSALEAARSPRAKKAIADAAAAPVESVMTTNVLTIEADDPIEKAVHRMRAERIGALPVLEKGKLVGILARSDILEAFVALTEKLRAVEVAAPTSLPRQASDEIRRNW